jgi:hypothetical protein
VQSLNCFLDFRVRLQSTPISEVVQPGLAIGFVGFQFLIQRASKEAQLFPEPDVITSEITSSGWQIVSRH